MRLTCDTILTTNPNSMKTKLLLLLALVALAPLLPQGRIESQGRYSSAHFSFVNDFQAGPDFADIPMPSTP